MTEITKKTQQDLRSELLEKRVLLREFRFGLTGSKTKNVKAGRNLRKDIARIETELTARRALPTQEN